MKTPESKYITPTYHFPDVARSSSYLPTHFLFLDSKNPQLLFYTSIFPDLHHLLDQVATYISAFNSCCCCFPFHCSYIVDYTPLHFISSYLFDAKQTIHKTTVFIIQLLIVYLLIWRLNTHRLRVFTIYFSSLCFLYSSVGVTQERRRTAKIASGESETVKCKAI